MIVLRRIILIFQIRIEIKYGEDEIINILSEEWIIYSIIPVGKDLIYNLKDNHIKVGRDVCNNIVLNSNGLSRNICDIFVNQENLMLKEDPKNKNGIFYFKDNSFKRIRTHIIKNNDIICFGVGNNTLYNSWVGKLKKKKFVLTFEKKEKIWKGF